MAVFNGQIKEVLIQKNVINLPQKSVLSRRITFVDWGVE